jgi:hypothetical protein
MGCLGGRTVDDDLRSAVAPTALFVLFVPSRYRRPRTRGASRSERATDSRFCFGLPTPCRRSRGACQRACQNGRRRVGGAMEGSPTLADPLQHAPTAGVWLCPLLRMHRLPTASRGRSSVCSQSRRIAPPSRSWPEESTPPLGPGRVATVEAARAGSPRPPGSTGRNLRWWGVGAWRTRPKPARSEELPLRPSRSCSPGKPRASP